MKCMYVLSLVGFPCFLSLSDLSRPRAMCFILIFCLDIFFRAAYDSCSVRMHGSRGIVPQEVPSLIVR